MSSIKNNVATNPKFHFWDSETTGIEKGFDHPVDIGFVSADANLNQIGETKLECRPPAHVLPAPGALLTTSIGISALNARQESLCGMLMKMQAFSESIAPTTYVSYNGFWFDDEIIRHSFYTNLLPAYAMNFNGHTRIDMLHIARCVGALAPGTLNVPTSTNGRPSFRLDMLAPANGFEDGSAHDALVDARATLHLARIVDKHLPEFWYRATSLWTDKNAVQDMLMQHDILVYFSPWGGSSAIKLVAPAAPNPSYGGEWGLADISIDPANYLSLSAEDIADACQGYGKPRPIHKVKANAMPMLFEPDDPMVTAHLGQDMATLLDRARFVRSDGGFAQRVGRALEILRKGYDEPEHVEKMLYSGGFVSREDETRLRRFHQAEPAGKSAILAEVQDPRMRELGRRLLISEWPDAVSASERDIFHTEMTTRLQHEDDVPWMTVPKALVEIAAERDKMAAGMSKWPATAENVAVLDEYEAYLHSLPFVAEAAE